MIDSKMMGWIQVVGAIVSGWFGYQSLDYGVLVLAVVVLTMGVHHLYKKK